MHVFNHQGRLQAVPEAISCDGSIMSHLCCHKCHQFFLKKLLHQHHTMFYFSVFRQVQILLHFLDVSDYFCLFASQPPTSNEVCPVLPPCESAGTKCSHLHESRVEGFCGGHVIFAYQLSPKHKVDSAALIPFPRLVSVNGVAKEGVCFKCQAQKEKSKKKSC